MIKKNPLKKPKKLRLDQLLVDRGLFETRTRAQAAVMEGKVLVDGKPVQKAGQPVRPDVSIELSKPDCPFVSRGGLKLQKALETFRISVDGIVALDVGASTGGFTDCLLQAGAKTVYAVDVGYGQLDFKLRKDPRVIVREKLNARGLEPEMFSPPPAMAVLDVSFISLSKVLSPAAACLPSGAPIVALIKPQFELSPKALTKGIVKDPRQRAQAVSTLRSWARTTGLEDLNVIESPIKGQRGNSEFLWHLRKS